jgi:hypothetical protein
MSKIEATFAHCLLSQQKIGLLDGGKLRVDIEKDTRKLVDA